MNLKKKAGMVLILLVMMTITAAVWYCLFMVNRRPSHMDGTFVKAVEWNEKAEMAA